MPRPKPKAQSPPTESDQKTLADLGFIMHLSEVADELGLTVADLAANKQLLEQNRITAPVSALAISKANALSRDRIDAALWRANGWIAQRVDEAFKALDRSKPKTPAEATAIVERKILEPSPKEQEEALKKTVERERERSILPKRRGENPVDRSAPAPKRVSL